MSLAVDLRTFLLADTAISAAVSSRIHQTQVPEEFTGSYVWFGRAGTEDEAEEAFDDPVGAAAFRERFDLEAVSDDIADAEALIDLIKAHHRHRGALGSGTVQALWIRDHADDYVPRNSFADEALHVASVQVEIVGYAA